MTGLLIVTAVASAVLLRAMLGQKPSAARVSQLPARVRRQRAHRGPAATSRGPLAEPQLPRFTARSIMPCRSACEAARQRSKQRYLKDEAPSLPLPECDASRCQCAYVEHMDRRVTRLSDRRGGIGPQSDGYGSPGEPERRRGVGRRSTDRDRRPSGSGRQ